MHLSKGNILRPLEIVQMSGMEASPSIETEYDNTVHSIVDRVDPLVLSGDRLKPAALLKKHQHVLSRNELDLVCTSIVQNRIDTDDHLPCRQAQRQQPITTRQIVDASLEEMFVNQTVEPSKCQLLQRCVAFLGFVVSEDGISTDEPKIQAVRDWRTPTSLPQSRGFVGLCKYYRRFVPRFSDIDAPLRALTQKGARFVWTEQCQKTFGIGAVLSNGQDGVERPVSFASQLLNKHERNYNATHMELLAVVTFVRKFKQYLLCRAFIMRTDHDALQWL